MASLLSGRFLPPVVASKFVIYLLIYLSVYLFNKFYLLVLFFFYLLICFSFIISHYPIIYLFIYFILACTNPDGRALEQTTPDKNSRQTEEDTDGLTKRPAMTRSHRWTSRLTDG